nr:hypothetical protein [Desulfobacterales bacterium]
MNEVFEYLDSFGPVYALPVVHYRVEFAEAVRHAFKNLIPDAVAVELPFSLQPFIERGIQRLPAASVVIYQNKKGDTIYFPIEPADPIVEAVRLGLESKTPVYFIDPDIDEYPEYRDYLPDTYGVYRLGIRTYYDLYRTTALPVIKKGPEDIRRERGMAYHLKELAGQYRRILFVCGMLHLEDVKKGFKHPQAMPLSILKREDVALFNLHPDDICEVFTEYPFLSAVYEYRRNGLPPKPDLSRYTVRKKIGTLTLLDGGKDSYSEEDALDASIRWTVHRLESGPLDRQKVMYHLFEQAAKHYHQDTGESVTPWQKRIFFRFSGNYARLDNLLVPDFYHLLVSARGSVDDNFCYAFWRLGSFYPWQDVISEVPTARLQGELLHLETRKIYIRRMIPRIKRHPIYVPQKRRLKEQRPGEWLEGFRNPYICSYPPEDLVIEDYGNFLKTKGRLILSEER